MLRLTCMSLAVLACILVSGCTSQSGSETNEPPTPATVSKLLASLDDGESSSLDHVSMLESQGGSVDAGTHEDELLQSGYRRADVGAVEWINGIETKLVVPMWYGDGTTIRVENGEPSPMPETVESTHTLQGPVVFFGDPVVSIEFHMEEGVLVLDKVVVPQTR